MQLMKNMEYLRDGEAKEVINISVYLEIVKFQKSQITISQKIKGDMSGGIISKQKKKQKK